MGRPTKLTDQVAERIAQALRAGNYIEPACRAAGIGTSTYHRWMQQGEAEPDSGYGEFRAKVERAMAESEVHAVAIVRQAMSSDWRAAIALLERRYPGRWKRSEARELTGADGGPIRTDQSIDLTRLSDEDLAELEGINDRAAQQD